MARAMTAGELTDIRKDNQWAQLYLAVLMPNTVMTATISTAPSSDDRVITLNLTGASWGSGYSTAQQDMMVYVGTSAGAYDKGFVRLREDLSGTPTTMKVGEVSEVAWSNGDHITIVDEFPLAPRHIYIDASQVVYMDRDLTYASQSDPHDDPDPVPLLGPSLVPVWLSGGTVDVEFDGSDSWTFDGTISSYAWAVTGTGSSIVNETTATPTVTLTQAGTFRVSCTVTGSNGKSFTGYRFIRAYDTSNMPIVNFTLEDCSGSWDVGGWSARIVLHAEADLTDIRERALVALFTKDYYGNTEASQGPITNRENILLVGWVGNESITWDPEEGTATIEIQGPHYWLGQMLGYPSGLEWVASNATAWTQMTTMTLQKALWQFLHWRATTTRLMDISITSDSRQFALFNASPGTLWSQMSSEAMAIILAHPCTDRFGRLFVEEEPQIEPTADRASIPTVLTVTSADLVRPVNLERRTVGTTGLVDLSGIVFSAGTGTSKFSLAPGHVFKWVGPNVEAVDRLALSSQTQANTLAGMYLGWRNAEYPNVSLPFGSNMRMIDITPQQYVTLTLSAGDTVRGVAVTITLVPRSVSFVHDPAAGQLRTDVQAESASVEASNQDGDVPPTPPDPAPPDLPVIDDFPDPNFVEGWPAHIIACTVGDATESTVANIYETEDFTGPGGAMPTWTKKSGNGLPTTRYARAFNADPVDKDTRLYLMTTGDELYHSSDGGDNWTKIMDNTTATSETGRTDSRIAGLAVDPENAGHVYVTWRQYLGFETYWGVLKSTDYGENWTSYEGGGSGWQSLNQYCKVSGLDIWLGGNWGLVPSWQVSHNGGSTWTAGGTLGSSNWAPFVYWNQVTSAMYMNEGGASFGTDLAKTTSDTTFTRLRDSDNIPPRDSRRAMWISVNDPLRMHLVYNGYLYYTDDAWSSMTTSSALSWNTTGVGWAGDEDADNDYKRVILMNGAAGDDLTEDPESIFVTDDWAATLENKSGTNYNTGPSYTDAIPSIDGGLCNIIVVDRDQFH